MFLFRAAFWLSLVVICLPSSPESDDEQTLSASQAITAVSAAYDDMSGICVRSPLVCDAGNRAFATFSDKARNGARMLYQYLDGTDEQPSELSADTLTAEDKDPAWAGVKSDGA